ncbi:MAG: HNH endonuclease [Phycisphaerae bacterium]|nr:HNH endonuclease [Phycisphaerae bacterium]
MPSLPPKAIVEAITDAFAEAGASAALVSDYREHPKRFFVSSGQLSFALWVYVWTATHGGGAARPRDEYRIQLTGVVPPLPLNPDGPTVLVGYEPNLRCFAGFDLRKHVTFSTKSPSIQVNINALRTALRDGFAFARKGNDEIVVAFRPDQILSYCVNVDALHTLGADAAISDLLTKATRFEPIPPATIAALPQERQRIVATVSRLARDSDFRRKVIVAYDHKCAVTGLQLRLVDAAHIIPVGAEGSSDEVTNGLCLSPTYHRAYDRGLIILNENCEMQINRKKERELDRLRLTGGLAEFKAPLGRQIILPADRRQWPSIENIRSANAVRQV